MQSPAFYSIGVTIECNNRLARLFTHPIGVIYALMAAAWGRGANCEEKIPEGLMIDVIEQSRIFINPGERYRFGYTLLSPDASEAMKKVSCLKKGLELVGMEKPDKPVALGGNFRIAELQDRVSGELIGEQVYPRAIPHDHIELEAKRIARHKVVTLRWTTPLRMRRPNGKSRHKNSQSEGRAPQDYQLRDKHAFFDGEYFNPDLFFARLHKHLLEKNLPVPLEADYSSVRLESNRLIWIDQPYGRERTRFSGCVGEIVLKCPDRDLARILAWGQYARVGSNTKFGLGAYRVKEAGPDLMKMGRSMGFLDMAMTSSQLREAAGEYGLSCNDLTRVTGEVLRGDYRPRPGHFVSVAMPHGNDEVLCIPGRVDLVLQSAVRSVIAPSLNKLFDLSSFANRMGLSDEVSLRHLNKVYQEGYRYQVNGDFARDYDSVNHDRLKQRLIAYLADAKLVRLIMKWIRAESMTTGWGLPAGSPLSPVLSDLFLNDFAEKMADSEGRLVRLEDEFLILYPSMEKADFVYREAFKAAQRIVRSLNETSDLHESVKKSFYYHGFWFEFRGKWIARPARMPGLFRL